MKNNKKLLIVILGILGIVLTTVGVTVAWFTYSRNGVKENTITAGSIKFHYAEGSRTIEVDDMMPMTDSQGKAQNDYFEFTITSDTSSVVDIPYYITARRTNSSDANMDSIVKVYLTKVDDNGVETQVLLSKFGGLSGYTNSAINIPASEKTLYNDTVLAGTQGYTQKYRLRMWIDYDAKYIVQEENQPDQYPLQDKSYALTVNVYSEGNAIDESTKELRQNADIVSMMIGTTPVTSVDGINYDANISVASSDAIPTTIEVDTTNPNAAVTVEKITAMGEIEKANGIRKVSTQKPLELALGTNNFKVTVISQDKSNTKIYNLTVTVEIKQPESFATDDWATIVATVKSGNGAIYAPNANGKEAQAVRPVDLGSLGTHYLRVANTTSCEDAKQENPNLTSQTACGFVIEFADSISNRQMSDVYSNEGGYNNSPMVSYLNNDIYDALPDDIKNSIINTTVVSSPGYNDRTCDTTSVDRDANCNYIGLNHKLYLLNRHEVVADDTDPTTRRLDYYSLNPDKSARWKENGLWWLRSTVPGNNSQYYYLTSNGTLDGMGGYYSNRSVSPAFRIGN